MRRPRLVVRTVAAAALLLLHVDACAPGDPAPGPSPGLAVGAVTGDAGGATDGTHDVPRPPDSAPDVAADAAGEQDSAGPLRCPAPQVEDPTAVSTPLGTVTGSVQGSTFVYKGIPYAAPPEGDLRWRPPVEAPCYGAPMAAADYGPFCPQLGEDEQPFGDEDCLHLNVWTPLLAVQGEARAAVLVFVHGGGNVAGGAAKLRPGTEEALYDGQALAEAFGVVVVTFNYRLGALGWLRHSSLDSLDPRGHSGNYGTLDQLAALSWVQRSIGAFGGDPERVLVFGESAGARNVCVLLASPLAAGLFSAALMQSGSCETASPAAVRAASDLQVQGSGCVGDDPDIAACLHAKTAAQLLLDNPLGADEALEQGDLEPCIDGHVLLDEPLATLRRGEHNAVPFLLGANTDETALSVPAGIDPAALERLVRAMFPRPASADRVLAAYALEDYGGDARQAWVQLTSDARFVCPTRRAARAASAGQGPPVFHYSFAQPLTTTPRLSAAGAFHGVELAFVFQHLGLRGREPSPAERRVAEAVGRYWTQLADHGDPNGPGQPLWEPYQAAQDDTLLLDGAGIRSVRGVRREQCDLWDDLDG